MRSVRIAPWRALAPKARSERLMHIGRSGGLAGFVPSEMASARYRYVASSAANASMC